MDRGDHFLEQAQLITQRNAAIGQAAQSEGPRLLNFIRRRIRDPQDAEDILQDVFYQLLVSYSVAEPIEKLTSWLFTVAKNKITDWYRKRRPVPLAGAAENGDLPLNPEDVLFDPQDNPGNSFVRSLVWSELAEALDELPEEQKEVFTLHEIDGKSFKEIAELTGEPVNTLLARKHYAVLFLRKRLREIYDEMQDL